jgi:protein-arginine kinase activator protein McsA
MNDDNLYNNLSNLLKIFQNKPHQLSKFLLESDALNSTFLKKIKSSSKLAQLDNSDLEKHFTTIDDMRDFYNSFISDTGSKSKNKEDLFAELLLKIKEAIDNENYEEAARIRDYMKKNNFKKS